MIITLPRIKKMFYFPIAICITGVTALALLATLPEEYNSTIISIQLPMMAGFILGQLWYGKRMFDKCIHCGHSRNQHDKEDLIRSGFSSITRIICDNFRKGNGTIANFESKYWSGETKRGWKE